MEPSILTSTKKILGLESDYTAFDLDVITHINTVFSTLNQLGVGGLVPFTVEDDTMTWDDLGLTDDAMLNAIKTYMYLRVRMFFDMPATSFAIAAMNEQIQQLEWRISVMREDVDWVDPDPPEPVEEEPVW